MALSVLARCSAPLAPAEAAAQREPPVVLVPEVPPAPVVEQKLPVVPAPTSVADVSGTWVGRVSERVGDEELSYQVCLQIPTDLDQTGSIAYFDGMTCAGEIRYVGSEDMLHTFAEYLTSGNVANGGECADRGRIEINIDSDGSLAWRWFQIDEILPQATATLEAGACP